MIVEGAPTRRAASGRSYTCWLCKCDCGAVFTSTTKQIRKGVRKSCGCKSKSSQFCKKTPLEVLITCKFNHYRAGARRRGIPWGLTLAEFHDKVISDCFYCGSPPATKAVRRTYTAYLNGVDRLDSGASYVMTNAVPCCEICNRAKGSMRPFDYVNWLKSASMGDWDIVGDALIKSRVNIQRTS